MSDPVLTQLLAADSDLEAQEAKLIAQLKTIKAQRTSLQSVLEIFESDKATADGNAAFSPDKIAEVAAASPTEAAPKGSKRGKVTEPKAKPTKARKAASDSKLKPRGWKGYLRDEYRQTPLTAVVSGILKSQPKKVFEISEVVNAIVVTEIPSTARQGARNRISNILAEGARKRQWRRLEEGCYRFSK